MNKKDFTQKDFENYIANKPSAAESDGAWKTYKEAVEQDRKLEKLKKFGEDNSSIPVKKKISAVDYVDKIVDFYEGGEDKIDPPILKNNINSERYVNKSLNKFENRTDNPNTVTFNPTTQLFTNKDRTVAIQDYNVANDYNERLGVKPNYPTQSTPKQFGELAERLEKDRQMRGVPTDTKKFANGFKDRPKPFVKKKISTPIEPVKLNTSTYTPYIPPAIEKDPQMMLAEKNFKKLMNEVAEEKYKKANSGLAALIGGDPKYGN